MISSPWPHKTLIGEWLREAGVGAWGVAPCEPVPASVAEHYSRWLADGCAGEMAYLEKYGDVRTDPRLLLDGARSIIVCAFAYPPSSGSLIASYALGDDYHDVLRVRLFPLVEAIQEHFGAECRICVDSAPMHERWHAWRAGLGIIGRNGLLIVPGAGTYVLIAEIVTTLELEADTPLEGDCGNCGRCYRSCPGHALDGSGGVDARRCHSYLTIEYRGEELPEGTHLSKLYGCDVCQGVCPHNKDITAVPLPEFAAAEQRAGLTREQVEALTPGDYKRLTRGSAMRRARLPMLLRNLRYLRQ